MMDEAADPLMKIAVFNRKVPAISRSKLSVAVGFVTVRPLIPTWSPRIGRKVPGAEPRAPRS